MSREELIISTAKDLTIVLIENNAVTILPHEQKDAATRNPQVVSDTFKAMVKLCTEAHDELPE